MLNLQCINHHPTTHSWQEKESNMQQHAAPLMMIDHTKVSERRENNAKASRNVCLMLYLRHNVRIFEAFLLYFI